MRRQLPTALLLASAVCLQGCNNSSELPTVPPPPPEGTVIPAPASPGVVPLKGKNGGRAPTTPNAL